MKLHAPFLLVALAYGLFGCAGEEAATKTEFLANPLDYCGALTDPVTKQKFIPGTRSPRFDYMGQPYYFLSDSTLTTFAAMPDSFEVDKRGMSG